MEFSKNKFCKVLINEGYTLKELEALTNINASNLSRYKNGRQSPNLKTIGRLAKALRCQPDDLIDI